MIHVAKAELVSAYKYAFTGAGMALGEAEDAARIAIWLDLCGLNAMSSVAESFRYIGAGRSPRPNVLSEGDSLILVDACGASVLEVGTAVTEYLVAEYRRRGLTVLAVVNIRGGVFISGLASVLLSQGSDATLRWGAKKPFHNMLVVSDGMAYQKLAQAVQPDSASLTEFELSIGAVEIAGCGSAMHQLVPQQRPGLWVDKSSWNSLQRVAGKVLVPESEVSRVAGAGIGADED